jgi:hypothetical protein
MVRALVEKSTKEILFELFATPSACNNNAVELKDYFWIK